MTVRESVKQSNVVDWSDPDRNMYGCAPCPKCASVYRAAYRRPTGLVIECDDCGHKEPAVEKEIEA